MKLSKPQPKLRSLNKIAPEKHTIKQITCTVSVHPRKLLLGVQVQVKKNVIYG